MSDFVSHSTYGKKLLPECRIYNNTMYIRRENGPGWTSSSREIKRRINQFDCDLTNSDINEIVGYLERNANEVTQEMPGYIIPFTNFKFNVKDGTLNPYDKDEFIPYCIPHNYNPDANIRSLQIANGILDSFADGNELRKQLLEEIMGLCLSSVRSVQKIFFLTGDGGYGKSTFLKLLDYLVGVENVCHFSMKMLDDRFSLLSPRNKTALIIDENDQQYNLKINFELLKQLSGDSPITARRMYQMEMETYHSFATVITAVNSLPDIDVVDNAIRRRMVIIPFTRNFSDSKKKDSWNFLDECFHDESVIEAFIKIAVEGFKRVLSNGDVSISEEQTNMFEEYACLNDSVLAFIREMKEKGHTDFTERSVRDVYNDYLTFCKFEGIRELSCMKFGKRFRSITGYTTDVRKKQKVYVMQC